MSKTFIIAELGCSHQGSVDIAKEMIRKAAMAGVDAVKVQKRNIGALNEYSNQKIYEGPNSFGRTYTDHRKALELSVEQHKELMEYTHKLGLQFGASCWDKQSIDEMAPMVDFLKLQSADSHNVPLITYLAQKAKEYNKPVIMSTGGSSYEQIEQSFNIFKQGDVQISILHCVPAYPAPFNTINLRNIQTLKHMFPETKIGYSGHENGIAISLAAVVMGAEIIERHFTLDRTMKGGDHAASLEPQGLESLVRDIRAYETALGTHERIVTEEEKKKLDSLNLTRKPFEEQ